MRSLDAYKVLVEGIDELDFRGSCVPCELLLTGDKSFPVLVNPRNQVLIAASQYEQGRMVVISHEGYLNNPKFFSFLQNAISWLKPSPEALVGVQQNFSFLQKTLSSNGSRTQSDAKFLNTFGVYCMDAHHDLQAEELVMFVKRGGGLLIGGQAWHWAQQNRSKKDILSFPGNKMTSVAGIHFTSNCAETGVFPVSRKMPPIPLMVKHGMDNIKDLKILLDGVTDLNIKTDGIPSALLVHGPLAFSIGLDDSLQSFLAAARYGKGRVVVVSHECYLSCLQLKKFILNAVSWLGNGKQGRIGIEPSLKDLYNLLFLENIDCELTELVPNLNVYCCKSYSDRESAKIHAFVAEGGGLLIGGQAWWWASQNQGKNPITEYPGNKILNKFGISILGHSARTTNCEALCHSDESSHYHFRKALSQLQKHIRDKNELGSKLSSWMGALRKECAMLVKMPDQDFPAFSSIHQQLVEMVSSNEIPTVAKERPIHQNSKEAFLLSVGTEIYNHCPCDEEFAPQKGKMKHGSGLHTPHPISIQINCTNKGPTAWRSTGLYLSPRTTGTLTFPPSVAGTGIEIQIGCHSDDLTNAQQFCRAPMVVRRFSVNQEKMSISNLWGGLLYIIVPSGCQLGKVTISVEGALQAPYFKHGKTNLSNWLKTIRHYPAPWAELASESIIFTVSSESVRTLENPEDLLAFWDRIMRAICELAAIPAPFQRQERIIADVQISAGWMHSGYPIMCHLESVKEMIDLKYIEAKGTWGFIHELGHNQQRHGWEFPPHTVEATCNLWSVYVHEEVMGIPRHKAHESLQPNNRVKRIEQYVRNGTKLEEWTVWTCLETYLQLQEGFGWKPFIQLFSDYQKMTNIKNEKSSKMNLWARLFSQQVKRNLAPFFQAWGWPIKEEVSQDLSSLPEWEDDPMKGYISAQFMCQQTIK
ncbi:TRPM8 channel-associated factor homolog [Rhinatrema bivittatum]|uniref:TRPM8 channel-associated factor homolog n=1 Tax=Rhinatrema bivittatum TaxID=194408 RepID=UPI00112AA96F|nr:TRPM8 channel-associated factor homolog [Rhinatrema bivittatum]